MMQQYMNIKNDYLEEILLLQDYLQLILVHLYFISIQEML